MLELFDELVCTTEPPSVFTILSSSTVNPPLPPLLSQILNVSAVVLANLCVSYIMTSQNEEVSSSSFHRESALCGVHPYRQ